MTQNTRFTFTPKNIARAKEIINCYPEGRQRSAIIGLLDIAQRQNDGWLPREAIEYVADFLNTPYIRAYEIASFYSMFNLKPVGKYHVQVCGTTPCWLNGATEIMSVCEKELGIKCKSTTEDGLFTLSEVECLGACVNAPMVQINDDYYEDLSPQSMKDILVKLKNDTKPKTGSQTGRKSSEPIGSND
jgi:NADH-quinone oxidoreductase E subunit